MIIFSEAAKSIMVGVNDYWERDFETFFTKCDVREIHIKDRFPSSGYALNRICNVRIRVLKGLEATLFAFKEGFWRSKKGDTFNISKDTHYYLIANPIAVIEVISEPPFSEEQFSIVYEQDIQN